jgi:hypothetical protein
MQQGYEKWKKELRFIDETNKITQATLKNF